jgi:cyclic-di-AMP phosphodiesterase PgpH
MRSLQSWVQQIWQAYHRSEPPNQAAAPPLRAAIIKPAWWHGRQPPPLTAPRQPLKSARRQPILIAVLATVALTSILGHRFYNQPLLDVGKVSTQTIQAPRAARVENAKATEAQRQQARTIALTILKVDPQTTDQVQQELQGRLERGNELRQMAGELPFVTPITLTLTSQQLVRQATAEEWQTVLTSVKSPVNKPKPDEKPAKSEPPTLKVWQQQVVTELQTARQKTNAVEFAALLNQIMNARQQYAAAVKTLADPTIVGSNAPYDPTLLALPTAAWQTTQTNLPAVATRMLAQGIADGLPPAALAQAINLQVKADIPLPAQALAAKLLATCLHANLVRDETASQAQAEQAAQTVTPVLVSVQQGDAIVQAGEVISPDAFILLDYFDLSRRGTNWPGLVGFGGLVSGAVGLFCWAERWKKPRLRWRDYGLVGLLPLTTPLLMALSVPSTNLPAIGILVGSFYGSPLAVVLIGLLSSLLPIGTLITPSNWLPSVAGGILAAALAGRLRTREELALLGVGIGLTQGIIYLAQGIITGTAWFTLLGMSVIHALLGLAWSIVAIGISPYLEHVFDLVTTVRLVELANPNRPLLKKLAADTPGTFQHTLFVATLAEAAARELGCNVELVRTGTLYHDIGKMHDPLGFIENQMGGPNKHDLINDPWKSAAIIKKHVTEGLVMARKARLPKAVQAFIPEHQGSMLIAYFYHQAQQRAEQDPALRVQDQDFRYDGPAPQSRETGIVMLADSCEAALRSLKDATPDQALNMINKILRARWEDGQLAATGLKREEMPRIARIFVQVWQQSNHQRIAYPKSAP